MERPLLTLQNVTLSFGDKSIFSDLSLSLKAGDRGVLVGRNGSGKSTLLKLLSGELEPDSGIRWLHTGVKIGRLAQNPDLTDSLNVGDYVKAGGSGNFRSIDKFLRQLKLDSECLIGELSGGEARRVTLCRIFSEEPDVILLDEPTNHLDIETIQWIEKRIDRYRGALLIISHDRTFLSNVCGELFWLDRGIMRRSKRGIGEFENWQEQIYRQEDAERARYDKKIEEELRWSREGISARRKRNQGRLRNLRSIREDRKQLSRRIGKINVILSTEKEYSRLVLDAEKIGKSFDGKAIIKDFSVRISRGDKVGLVGPNGIGKTTLLRLLIGNLKPDRGIIRSAKNISSFYLDQQRTNFLEGQRVRDFLCPAGGEQVLVNGRPRHVVGYMKEFLFDSEQIRQPITDLSGGEQSRLLLARAFCQPSNFLILDEPTNDLDLETLDLLQELLSDYQGALIVASHDRDFLDRLVTSTIVLSDGAESREYFGGYTDYISQNDNIVPKASVRTTGKSISKLNKKSQKTKLSYIDQRRLDQLPALMAKMDAELLDLETRLSDPHLFVREPESFRNISTRFAKVTKKLADLEEEWLELEIRSEELRN